MKKAARLGAIVTSNPPRLIECADGNWSTATQGGFCSYHGGAVTKKKATKRKTTPGVSPAPAPSLPRPERLPEPDPVTVMPLAKPTNQADVFLMPVQAISIRRDWFQNRATPYSERSVANIIAAVQNGAFNWVNMDPVTLWAAGDGKTYMLSGHSRLEAFERLCKMGAEVDGRNFCAIPAKVGFNLSLEQARQIALESNTLSTKESDLERAEFYRKARQAGKSEQSIKEDAKRLEGQNWTTIYAISFLAPTGKMMTALNALEKGDATSRGNAFTIARWIGNARAAVKSLTDRHENEIYDWLITGKGYGTKTGQVSNEREFSNRLTSIINRRSEWGVLAESLNIQNNITLSPVERQYNEELQQAAQVLRDLERDINNTLRSYKARGATDTELMNVTAGTQAALARARINYTNLLQKKSDVTQYAKQEKGLFDELSGIKKRRSLFNYYL